MEEMMSSSYRARPAVSIDFKRDRIRIHKSTLRAIGDPEYILLLINPGERTLAILWSERSDMRSYHLPRYKYGDKECCEISSKPLLNKLLSLCSCWQGNHLYRVYGEVIPHEKIVQFCLDDGVIACGTRG